MRRLFVLAILVSGTITTACSGDNETSNVYDSDADALRRRRRVDAGEPGATCTPSTCAEQGATCGSTGDGCGGTLDCGGCTAPETCGGGGTPNVCGGGMTPAPAGPAIYIAQNAQGDNSGSSCSNAHAASWFNTGSNWGAGSGKIAPGVTVRMCGTITSHLTFQGSGTPDNYITLDGTGSLYSGTISNGLPSAEHSWWKVQHVTYADGNGGNTPMTIYGGSNGVFTKNHADNFEGGNGVWIAQGWTTLPSNITISNNFLRTTTADLGLDGQLDIISTEGSTNVVIENNYLEMRAGGSGGGSQHDDVIQTFESGSSGSHGAPSNWVIRYNRIVMNSPAANDRSWTMIEALGGNNYIYGNVFLGLRGAGGANGLSLDGPSGTFYVNNNTIVAKNGASNNTVALGNGTFFFNNNAVHTVNQTAFRITQTSNKTTRTHNLWYGSNIPSCSGITGEMCGKDSLFADYANNDFSLRADSPAIGAGANLGAPYDGYVLPGSSWPNPTLGQRTGPWNIGTY